MNSLIKEIDPPLSVIDTLQTDHVLNGENSVKLGRDKNGRFTSGNNFSVGNKGGRPKKMTALELIESFGGIHSLVDRALTQDDDDALYAILLIESGKYK